MSKRILIVGAGANQLGTIKKAHEMGLDTVAIDGSATAPGLATARTGEVANIVDPDAVTQAARKHTVDGIYPAAEWGVEASAQAAANLGLPGVPPEVAHRVRNKLAMREQLEQAGLPGPLFRGVLSAAEARRAGSEIGLPVIVKPADGNASRGVQRVDAAEELPAAFARAHERTRSGIVLIETFMEGDEFNVDGLMFDGAYTLGGITAKERSAPPDRFDLGIFMPPLEDPDTLKAVEDTVSVALRAIGFLSGTTHVEVILTDTGPRIVEMAGRPGGGRIPSDLIPLTYGVDFMADSLHVALGEPPRETRQFERGTAVYWIPARPGVVVRIEGLDEARSVPGVCDIVLATKPGDTIAPIVDCVTRDAIGYVMTAADTPEAAIAAAKRARECCRIITRAE